MIYSQPQRLFISVFSLIFFTGCANNPQSKTFEELLAADPALNNPTPKTTLTPPTSVNPIPADFPSEIPVYPNAQLTEQIGTANGKTSRWITDDPSNAVESYYRQQLVAKQWQLSNTGTETTLLQATRQNQQLKLILQTPTIPGKTSYTLEYSKNQTNTPSKISAQVSAKIEPTPSQSPNKTTPKPSQTTNAQKIPAQLQPYIDDLNALGIFPDNNTLLEPNKIITRREFARWLLAANNKIHINQPAKQIRVALESSTPIFNDIPAKDTDFALIQGLAEAGIIPSPLTGDNSQTQFRPDSPLTRETLILWKLPLDTRQALPTTSVDTVQKTWGFQDTAKIDPDSLKAVSADYQNGDLSNIRRAFGYTTLFQPKKPVTRAEAAVTLWYFGTKGEGLSAKDAQQLKPSAPSKDGTPPT